MNYYIADTHFGHQNIIRFCNRPFSDVLKMQEVLINNWNRVVKDQDDVYIVGDMFFKIDKAQIEAILKQLKGKKHLIIGNHDNSWLDEDLLKKYFVSCDHYLEIHDCKKFVVLSHYPMLSYNKQSGGYMIHGHIHNDTLFDYWPVLVKRERILNAGVDINNFKPVTINELIINNQAYKEMLLKSYPCYLLSIRFNIGYINSHDAKREELYEILNPLLAKHHIIEKREGLYEILDTNEFKFLKILKEKLASECKLKKIIKDFDLIYLQKAGSFIKSNELIQ